MIDKKLINKTIKLIKKTEKEDSYKARAKLALHFLAENLLNELRYCEEYIGFSGRDFDNCFEMFDGELVVYQIIETLESNDGLKQQVLLALDKEQYVRWLGVHKSVSANKQHYIEKVQIELQQHSLSLANA